MVRLKSVSKIGVDYFGPATMWLTVVFTFLLGIVNTISAVGVPLSQRLMLVNALLPGYIVHRSRVFVLVAGLLLIILSYQLILRSRNAWRLTILLVCLSFLAHLAKGFDLEEAIFALTVLVFLVLSQKQFRLRHPISTAVRSLQNISFVLVAAVIFGVVGFTFLDQKYFGVDFTITESLIHWARLFFGFSDASLVPHRIFGRAFETIISASGVFTVIYAFLSFFRPAIYAVSVRPRELAVAVEILHKYGHDTLDYFKTYHDKNFYFTESGDGFIAYRVQGYFAFALSDPVCDPAKINEAIRSFSQFAWDNGWKPVFVQTSAKYLDIYRAAGFNNLMFGEDAVILPSAFSLEGPEGKDARYYLNKFNKDKITLHTYDQLSDKLYQRLRIVNSEWLNLENHKEHAFTEGYFERSNLENETIFTVENEKGEVFAFATTVEYDGKLAHLDLLRRRTDIPAGTMNFLIYSMTQYYKERNFGKFNLSLAPLAGTLSDTNIPEKTIKVIQERLSYFYSFLGLRQFKEKFKPVWEPRYIIYESNISLPNLFYELLKVTKK